MVRSKEIPAMITVTITGADERMYDALKLTIQRENRKRKANHEEPIPYIINQSFTIRPSISSQSTITDVSSGSMA